MKKILSFSFVLVLLICLSITAFASLEDCQVGEYTIWCVEQCQLNDDSDTFDSACVLSGEVPGMTCWASDECVWFAGTPTMAGSYYPILQIVYRDGSSYTPQIHVQVAPAPQPEYITSSFNFTAGKESYGETGDCSSMIQSHTISSGVLPAGLEYTVYDTYISVYGTPAAAGLSSVTFACTTEGEPAIFTLNIAVSPAVVPRTIIMQPMDVTLEEGQTCEFRANADGNGWCAWRFYKPDGTEVIFDRLNALGSPYDAVMIEGGNSCGDTPFRLRNVPLEMNGWTVACLFSTADNTRYSTTNRAKITVIPAPAPEPDPEPAEEPVPPVPSEIPALSDPPVPSDAPAPSEPPAPAAAPTAAEGNGNSTLLIVLSILCGALIIAVAILLSKLKKSGSGNKE